jgi:hypothetical protein
MSGIEGRGLVSGVVSGIGGGLEAWRNLLWKWRALSK